MKGRSKKDQCPYQPVIFGLVWKPFMDGIAFREFGVRSVDEALLKGAIPVFKKGIPKK